MSVLLKCIAAAAGLFSLNRVTGTTEMCRKRVTAYPEHLQNAKRQRACAEPRIVFMGADRTQVFGCRFLRKLYKNIQRKSRVNHQQIPSETVMPQFSSDARFYGVYLAENPLTNRIMNNSGRRFITEAPSAVFMPQIEYRTSLLSREKR